jgi:uncharacterized protein HemY
LQGDYRSAESYAREGLAKTTDTKIQSALHKNLGWALFGQKRFSEAQRELQNSLELNPQRVDSACLLAQVQESLSKFEAAKPLWTTCLTAWSNDKTPPEVLAWRDEKIQSLLKDE